MDKLALIIFGITSNLAQIKLLPALYDMEAAGMLSDNFTVIGSARRKLSDEEFKNFLNLAIHSENRHHDHPIDKQVFERLCKKIHYLSGDLDEPEFYTKLKSTLEKLNKSNHIFYLATYPDLYKMIFDSLKSFGLTDQSKGFVRLMIEKPIGNDLKSAKELNKLLLGYFKEDQIYRLDHYLGKDTIQNILTFRFGNSIFDHLLNKDFIDHIQITATESFGVGQRGGYYDSVGALKDFGQNHLLQMLAFITMDKPKSFTNSEITKQRTKVLESLVPDPMKIIFGQYEGYLKEANIQENSQTDTYFAFKTTLTLDRFKNIPVYIRSGKCLKETVTEINIIFKNTSLSTEPNVLTFRIYPNAGIVIKMLVKGPGHTMELEPAYMQFCYKDLSNPLVDPYEHLIGDTIIGDQTFFNDAEEVEAQWRFVDPLLAKITKPHLYKTASWGPDEADRLIEDDGRSWLLPSMDFCPI